MSLAVEHAGEGVLGDENGVALQPIGEMRNRLDGFVTQFGDEVF